MSEQTVGYEEINGGYLRPEWDARMIPVPSRYVRDRAGLPERYQFASLHADLWDEYSPVNLDVATRFVADWPYYQMMGTWVNFFGKSGAGKTHTAAAMVNEIILRHTKKNQFKAVWLPVARLGDLFNYRTFGKREEYYTLENDLRTCHLLVVDDLGHAADFPMVREYLFGIYDYRYQRKRPIITTANFRVSPTDWSEVERAFNEPFARRLRETAQGFNAIAQ
jgi:DNA replication protein DnaC